ncbi:radical SAM protein [Caloranaerobacter sp. DY30410]|uniref:radical SAM protein n=1 Tax=Caloranaerobacter sp. DY30410 TaxID=3238305 RepID=UPI003D044B44
MPLINQQYQYYKREENYLLIFPEIPYWLVTKKGGFKLVQLLTKHDSIADVVNILKKEFDLTDPENIVLNLFNQLKKVENKHKENNCKAIGKEIRKISIAEIVLSRKCNLNCMACYRNCSPSDNRVLSKKEIYKFLKGIKHISDDTCEIGFVGGEPLLHWDLLVYSINAARKLGYKNFYMDTNATLITEKKAKALFDLGIKEVTVLLDGVSSNVHELTRDKNVFHQIIRGIRILRDTGIVVTVRMTVHNQNKMQIEGFIKFCVDEKVYPSINPLAPLGRAQNLTYDPVSLKEIFISLKNMVKRGVISEHQAIKSIYHFFINDVSNLSCKRNCGIGFKSVLLNNNGDIYPCIESLCSEKFVMGSIKVNSFIDIWCNSKIRKILSNLDSDTFSKCNKCDLKFICAGHCRALSFHSTKKFDAPFIWCKSIHDTYIEAMWSVAELKNIC